MMKDISLQAQVEEATPHELSELAWLSESHAWTKRIPLCEQMLNAQTNPTKKMKMLQVNTPKDFALGEKQSENIAEYHKS